MSIARKACHFSALAFTAFWLVATSRPRQPARDCFVPLTNRVLDVTVGAHLTTSAAPSCAALDGLSEGTVLRARVQHGASAPQVYEGTNVCWSYGVSELTGPAVLSELKGSEESAAYPNALFDVEGAFVSSASPTECWGDYRLVLEPARPVASGKVLDPRRAGAGEAWRVKRIIRLNLGQRCPLLPKLPQDYCEDSFEVRSIGHAP